MEFHVIWHRAADQTAFHDPTSAPTWSESLARPWEIDFETAVDRLAHLERMFVEPDGSFVWRPSPASQLDGVLYDREGRLCHVEIKGAAAWEEIERLQSALNREATPLSVQLVRAGVVLPWNDWQSTFQSTAPLTPDS